MAQTKKAPAAKAAKKSSGISYPAIVIIVLIVLCMLFFFQILGDPSNFNDEARMDPKNFMGIVFSGGVIVPILMSFVLTAFVFGIERAMVIRKARGTGNLDDFAVKTRNLIRDGKIAEAEKLAEKQRGTVGNVVKTAVAKYAQLQDDDDLTKEQKLSFLQREVEEATALELPILEKNLPILSTLGSVSTLVALLGTVLGMIRAFFALGSGGGSPDAAALSKGIAEALVNTAIGIGGAAIAIILYNYFTTSIDKLTYKIDEIGLALQQTFSSSN